MKIERNPVLVAIGKQIQQRRRERRFSQEGFAAAADIDRSYYGSIERGERNIAALNLVKIAMVLEVNVGDLFPDAQVLKEALAASSGAQEDAQI